MLALQRGFTGFSMPFFFVMVLSSVVDAVDVGWIFWLAPVGFVVGAGYGLAYYYRFTYALTADTFDVTSGVLSRRSREIPYRRVQNVDVSQGLVQRLLGLAVVSIETAGGGATEATLRHVSSDEAERIRTEIRRRTAARSDERGVEERTDSAVTTDADAGAIDGETTRSAPTGTPDVDDGDGEHRSGDAARIDRSPTLLFELEARELLVYAGTAFRWGAAIFPIALVVLLLDVDSGAGGVSAFLVEIARPFGGPESIDGAADGALVVLSVITALQWVVATYVASGLYTIANYYGFRLGRRDNDLVYERGLLQRYSGSIPTDKIQSVTITDNPLQRLVGYAGLWVETAGYGPESSGGSQSAVPLAAESRVYRFATALTGVDRAEFRAPPRLARRRYLARYTLLAAGVVAAAFAATRVTGLERWYLAAVVFAAVPPAAHLKYANLGYFVAEDHLVIRRGFWRRRTTVIPYYRVQTVSTRRSLFQRRLGLASLVIDTASSRTFVWSTPAIPDLDLETARDLRQTCRERLQTSLREREHERDDGSPLAAEFP
ncbi:PH domain-containing protein [Haloterrigena alkaliphila]|uniref:PH domain-containing protein n=1 Tax=Haloterrigena alkaliphila TaxID=2816475 RepID=A0A8A2VL21_9EURY|nr:PH domain-containing protein [Haloterrigena alkaliphila]QSX01216.1 PH domain-containing protein [Haloterrigena alkaliphila]